jgi:uncharacterized damage-inducible protein DinB
MSSTRAGAALGASKQEVLLTDISADQARSRPIRGAHSIIELVSHVTAWTLEVASRLRGNAPSVPAIGDWPPVGDEDVSSWDAVKRDLRAAHQQLLAVLAVFPADKLPVLVGAGRDAPLGTGVTFAAMLLGLAQHTAYHSGQIALLKRALTAPSNVDA